MSADQLPVLTARQIIGILERMGFQHRPLKASSHRRYVHPDGRRTIVPVHPSQDIGRGLLRKILKDFEAHPASAYFFPIAGSHRFDGIEESHPQNSFSLWERARVRDFFVGVDLGVRPHPGVNEIDFTLFGTHFPDEPIWR